MDEARTSRSQVGRALAALGALIALSALSLQFVLTLRLIQADGGSPLAAVWRFLGYFTILSNLLVLVTLARDALRSGTGSPRLELATANAIVMVGIVYSLLLRATWNPQGAQKIADTLLHDVSPLVSLVWFLTRPRAPLRLTDALYALAPPLLYVLYAIARGAADGWYAYWFLDPRIQPPTQLALYVVGLALAFFACSLVLTFISNRLNKRATGYA